jgi:PIN domain
MSVDLPTDSQPKKKQRAKKSQLKVVFDTNALYVTPNNIGSASDLVRQEIANVISEARYPDLEILWHLPEIVRHERQYQMQAEALKLRPAINKIERLLNHNLALTDQLLESHVKTKIEEKEQQLGLQEIKLDHNLIDWSNIIYAAAYRKPPFEAGEKEKGFRDALVAESFLQLLAVSTKTPNLCRVVLITSDTLLAQAVKERIANLRNASVLSNLEELKGLINTIVSNVEEDFIAQIKPKAAKLFFVSSEEKETLIYKENIQQRLREKFKSELETKPQGTTFRENGTWRIDWPNFSRKDGRRVYWISRIEIELEAGTVTNDDRAEKGSYLSNLVSSVGGSALGSPQPLANYSGLTNLNMAALSGFYGTTPMAFASEKKVITHRGADIFEVQWSTEVTLSKNLKKPVIDDIVHVELSCQPIL